MCVSAVGIPPPYSSYIQGGGDDEECWAAGLTASLFSAHREDITNSEDVEATVNSVVAEHRKAQSMPSNSAMRIETCRIKQTAVYIGQVYPVGDTSADDTSSSAVAFTPGAVHVHSLQSEVLQFSANFQSSANNLG